MNLYSSRFGATPWTLTFAVWLCCLPILVGCGGSSSEVLDLPHRANVILILADDQGWNGTSLAMDQGNPLSKSDSHLTPHLEALAARGMRFSQARAAAPVCAPSRYSIQFGKSPARLSLIRVGMNTDHIDHEGWTSIPRAIKAVDSTYVAAHFGKWGMGATPKALGYDISDGPTRNMDGGFVNNPTQWNTAKSEDPKKIFSLTQRGMAFVDSCHQAGKPFFLQLSHYAVHSNIETREATWEEVKKRTMGERHAHLGMASMTEDLDDGLGMLMDHLKALGLEDDTYVIYMADNGAVPSIPGGKKYEQSLNHPLRRGKWDAMEGGLRVPMVVAGPGIGPNTQSNVPVWGCDLLPTICEFAGGAEVSFDNVDGGSMAQVLSSEGAVVRSMEGMVFHVPYQNKIALNRAHSALVQGDHKLIHFHDDGSTLLFEVAADLGETVNLSEVEVARRVQMDSVLMQYLDKVDAPRWQPGITWKNLPLESFDSWH
tara:strand:+ start:1257 stop:2711 length:1455 start_codon:yes stop_codon:yes gene_type:complete